MTPSSPSSLSWTFSSRARRRRHTVTPGGARAAAVGQVTPAVVLTALPDGRFMAAGRLCRLAASCLAIPLQGDTVLVSRVGGTSWIIAVLADAGTRSIHVAGPEIRLKAELCELHSTRLKTGSRRWEAVHADIELNAGKLRAVVAAAEGLFGTLSSWARTCFASRERSMRQVSGVESVRCGTMDVQASELLALGGTTSVLQAQGMLKIDGAQVLVG